MIALMATALAAGLLVLELALGQQIHRDGFESRDTVWVKGPADTAYQEVGHSMSETAHTGQRSEMIQVHAEQGNFIHYLYDTGRVPIQEDMSASVWIRSNRPGLKLLGRLVLPHERNPSNLDEPLTTLIAGDVYQTVGRWQRLELRRAEKLVRDQQALLRAELKHEVNLEEAYIDRLVLNVYGGPGDTQVWIDDLEVGPVIGTPAGPQGESSQAPRPAGAPAVLASRSRPHRPTVVDLSQEQLRVGGQGIFFRAIRHTDTPLEVLHDAGFNTIWLGENSSPEEVEKAVALGFWVVPSLSLTDDTSAPAGPSTYLTATHTYSTRMNRFLNQDAVLFWDLGGGGLAVEQSAAVGRTAQLVRALDPQRPLAADVWDGFQPYSRSVNLLGVHRWPLMTGLELGQYRDWLNQRRLLASPGTFMWTWVQTHLPDWHTNLVYERGATDGKFDEPVGPLPEQVRLLTYLAVASGCKGVGFWSDRFLADSHQGRDRWLELSLLNQELKLLEPLLVGADTPTWLPTSAPGVSAALLRVEQGDFRNERALLLLPVWMGRGAQFVPGQGAARNVSITVPQVPDAAQAWEVTPAEIRPLQSDRIAGGLRVTLPEFGLTSAVVLTADNSRTGLLVHLQDEARKNRKMAAQWAHDLAEAELEKVVRVHAELEQDNHRIQDGQALLDDARRRLQLCARQWNDGQYPEAYAEAQRAARPLGILMRAEWEEAAKDLDAPVASPYAVSYFTLPRHWRFVEQIERGQAAANTLPGGDFESAPAQAADQWSAQEVTLDDVDLQARRVGDKPHDGSQCLLLEVKPKNPAAPPLALERTFLAIHSPAVRLQPGTQVRLTAWVRIPVPIASSADGVLLYDSVGGEPLAMRLLGPITKWRQFTWYRTIPKSGSINVTLALSGLGQVYFDDVRIEPIVPGKGELTAANDRSLRSPRPDKPVKDARGRVTGHVPGDP